MAVTGDLVGDCKGGQPSDPGFSCNGFCAKMEDIERYLCPLLMTVKKLPM